MSSGQQKNSTERNLRSATVTQATGRPSSPHTMVRTTKNSAQSKTHTPSPLATSSTTGNQLAAINSRIDELTSMFERKFDDILGRLIDLDNNHKALFNEINDRISSLENNLTEKDDIINEISTAQTRAEDRILLIETAVLPELRSHITRLEENAIASNIVIRGIPDKEDLDLKKAITTLFETINCPNIHINHFYRIKNITRKPNSHTTDAGVIVHLKSPTDKAALLKSAANFRKDNNCTLQLKHAGLTSEASIYMNECLTKSKKHILNAAVQLKRKKRLHAVYTLRGKVYVKKLEDDSGIEITHINMLDAFAREERQEDRQQSFRADS